MPEHHSRPSPVLDRTINCIREYITKSSLHPGDLFPSTRVFALHANVSYVTMCTAMRAAAKAGLLVSANNRRYRVAGPGFEKAATPRAIPVDTVRAQEPWQRAVSRIESDILNGAFKPGTCLPTRKELQFRYGVSYPTIAKALDSLTARLAIERRTNGSYAVPLLISGSWKSTIVVFITSPDWETLAFGQHDGAVYRAFEVHCEQAGLRIDIQHVVYEHQLEYHRFQHRATGVIRDAPDIRSIDNKSILGYVYLIPWFPRDTDRTAIDELSHLKKPVIVMDETSLLDLPERTLQRPCVRVFSAAVSRGPGMEVARHLLSLGHRKIAYISTDHDCIWSQRRCEGLQSAFAKAGCAGGVVPFVTQATVNIYEHGTNRCDFTQFDKAYAAWRINVIPPYRTEFDYAIERMHVDSTQRGECRCELLPMLNRALADPDITAWVASNDFTASIALAHLKKKDVRVPAQLSVISFDDSLESQRNHFSSYNFNASAHAAYIIGTITGRTPFAGKDARVEGFIVNRGSTGPAAKIKR